MDPTYTDSVPVLSENLCTLSPGQFKMAHLLAESENLHTWSPGQLFFINLVKNNSFFDGSKTLIRFDAIATLMNATIPACSNYWDDLKKRYLKFKADGKTDTLIKYLDGTLDFIDERNFGKKLEKFNVSLANLTAHGYDSALNVETQSIPNSTTLITQEAIDALLKNRSDGEPTENAVVNFVSQVITSSLEKQLQASVSPISNFNCEQSNVQSNIRYKRYRQVTKKLIKTNSPKCPLSYDPDKLTQVLDEAAQIELPEPENKKKRMTISPNKELSPENYLDKIDKCGTYQIQSPDQSTSRQDSTELLYPNILRKKTDPRKNNIVFIDINTEENNETNEIPNQHEDNILTYVKNTEKIESQKSDKCTIVDYNEYQKKQTINAYENLKITIVDHKVDETKSFDDNNLVSVKVEDDVKSECDIEHFNENDEITIENKDNIRLVTTDGEKDMQCKSRTDFKKNNEELTSKYKNTYTKARNSDIPNPFNSNKIVREFFFELGYYVSRRFATQQQEEIKKKVWEIINNMDKT